MGREGSRRKGKPDAPSAYLVDVRVPGPEKGRPMKLRVAQVRVRPVKGNLEANRRLLMAALDEVVSHQPDVVITPECFLDGYVVTETYVTRETLTRYAVDPESSAYTAQASDWAASCRSWLIYGCARRVPEGVTNSALVFDRSGALAGTYDKVHCQTHDRKLVPGQGLPVFESDFGRFGVMICADRRWPETVRTLALKGARIVFNPTYGMHDERNLWMMRTRSYESEVFIAFTHPVQSLLTGPRGELLCNESFHRASFSVTEIDLSEVETVRSGPSAHLRDRRPDVYEM